MKGLATMALRADGISNWLSDTSDDVLKRIAAGAVEANQWMMLKAIDQINSGLRINVGASWLQDVLAMMRYLVLPVVALLFLLQLVTAMLARSSSGMWRAVWGSALGLILGAACAVLTAGLLLIVDQFSAYVLGAVQNAAQDGIKKAFAMQGAIEGSGWLVVTVIAALGILAWATIILVLFLRKAMIIATLVFAPFAMAGLASGKTKTWAIKWFEVVFALALSKFVICAILTLAYSAIASSITGDITDALLGSVWVLLAAASPLAVLRFVHFASDQITAANTTGAASAISNARRGVGMSRSGAAMLGGAAGAVGGWLAGRGSAGIKTPRPSSPATAVGGRPSAGATGAGATGAGTGATPAGATGAGAAANPGGSTGSGPSQAPSEPVNDQPPAAPSTGTADGMPTPASAAGSPANEQPDPAVQPAMDAYFAQAAAESNRPVVTPAAAAAALSIPQTQADRMFFYAETQGVLGTQQADGSRRVLAAPPVPIPGGTRV